MATTVVETTSVDDAIEEEYALPPGFYEVKIHLIAPISRSELNQLQEYLLNQGVDIRGRIRQSVSKGGMGLWFLTIRYVKHPVSERVAWAAALIALLPLLIVSATVAVGIVKLPDILAKLTPILIGGGILTVAVLVILRRPAAMAAERYIERKFR